ncbi:hypothetical protein F5Y13DRAFT_121305 [Hypoxylon sp. FL1857]|nr:hypothetical protein F5Y13DRAFT_121305 [Hypoxylon sp. FL1857]
MSETARLRTAKAFISMFGNLDTSLLSSILAPSYVHTFAPASLQDRLRTKGKTEMVSHIASLRNIMTGFPVYAKSYFECDAENMVTVWATSKVEWKEQLLRQVDNPGEWEYEGEYIFFIWLDETGEKIVRVVEFLDSFKTVKLMGLMKTARELGEK